MSDPLADVIAAVQSSAKYNCICEDVIRRVGAAELGKRRKLKDAIKATKNKLHQVGGAYLADKPAYDRWRAELQDAYAADTIKPVCRAIMQHHASTRERLPILDEFYATVLADLAPVQSVIDVACGLNPLAIPWMPLAEGAIYYAYDMYYDLIDFVDTFIQQAAPGGRAETQDAIQFMPPAPAQVALILKTIPCLEQADKAAGERLLDVIPAQHLIVSFPVRSLGGREKGMADHYETHLTDLIAQRGWPVQRFEFETELAFLITKAE